MRTEERVRGRCAVCADWCFMENLKRCTIRKRPGVFLACKGCVEDSWAIKEVEGE